MEPTWSIWHLRTKRPSCVIKALQERQQTTSHLLLHQVFKLCDLLSVFRVARDVLLIKESLQTKEKSKVKFMEQYCGITSPQNTKPYRNEHF